MNKVHAKSCGNICYSLYKNARGDKRFHFIKLLKSFLLSIIIISANITLSQTPQIDSLKKLLNDPKTDELSTLLELCERNPSLNADTAMVFAERARQISLQHHDFQRRILSEFYIAECYSMKGRADSSLDISNRGLSEIPDADKYFPVYRDFMWNKIVCLTKLRKIKESIDECYNLLSSSERNNDIPGQVIAYNCLGVNDNILENRAEALSNVRTASTIIDNDSADTNPDPLYSNLCGIVFINLSAMYFRHNVNDSGFYFLREAFNLAKKDQNLRIESNYYNLEGQVYLESNKTDSAEYMLKKSLDIQKQIGSVQNILVGLDAMETFYGKEKNYGKAIETIREAQWYANRYNEPLVFQTYRDLASYYKAQKNYIAYGETIDTLTMLKDSLYQKSKAEDLAKLEAQYDVSSKEAFIAKQKLELLHKNIWIAGVAMTLLLLLTGSFFTYRHIRRKQKVALDIAEEKERKRIAADLHDNIGAYAAAISENIDEMENRKLITDDSFLQNLKSNSREIISSLRDTIWAFNKDAISLTGISDRLKIYLQRMQQSYPGIQISQDENINGDLKMSPAQALHIFRILQEAIHNALTHSGGSKVTVRMSGNESLADISVEDNGVGFDPEMRKNEGNGINNMKSRAGEAGFNLSFHKAEPLGTIVRLTWATLPKK
jgi:signal transduction histidine kinase